MKIYLIRHGETTGDLEDRYGGSYDDHLTEKGREQIEATASKLVGKKIEIIFSSPLIRAVESSKIISDVIKAPIEYVNDFRERHYGVLTGLIKSEAQEKYPEAVKLYADYKNTVPEGESYEDFHARIVSAFSAITSQKHAVAALVAHAGPIRVIYRHLGKGELGKLEDGHILEVEV